MIIKLREDEKEFKKGVSTLDIAKSISDGLARVAVCGKIGDELIDLNMPINADCQLEIITNKSPEYQEVLRHSTAHVLAQAVKTIYPTAKCWVGPAIKDGYYYDFDFSTPITNEDLLLIENEMSKIVKSNLDIVRKEVSKAEAIKIMEKAGEPYKVELIKEFPDDETISIYTQGDYVEVCRGPHIKSTGLIKVFKLTKMSGAYLKGDSKNKMLTRIYGVVFDKKSELDEFVYNLEEAKKRDHKKLGKELELFMLSPEGPGFPFFLPNGMILRNQLEDFWKQLHRKNGYVEVKTPIILNEQLWHTSGHWDHYKENMYLTKIDGENYGIKPMNCPGGMLIYKNKQHSYKEFPIRMGELGLVHRHEKSGELNGLFRVRCFTQDDAHIFCLVNQIEDEIAGVIELVNKVYKIFGFEYSVELSTRPENSMGTDKQWEMAESALEKVLKKLNIPYELNKGDGAFYGPKIDFHIRDCLGRSWQCGTIQLDFQMPERFDLTYIGEDNEEHRPIMLHRVIFGSIERFIGIITEHFAGAFPTWLAPIQVRLISISEKYVDYVEKIRDKLEENGIRTDIDSRNEKIGYKIREAQLKKIPYMLVIGDKEIESNTVGVRSRKDGDLGEFSVENFMNRIKEEIANFKL